MVALSTLRPGLLVSLKTSCRGNVTYEREDLEVKEQVAENEDRAEWLTKRTIADVAEHKAAEDARSKARSIIARICTQSAFGLLCPEADADKLDKAVAEARELVDEFNRTAALTRVHVYVIAGRIAQDDVEAVKAINSEVQDLLDAMVIGVEKLDVKAIRDAAAKAKQLGSMLTPAAKALVGSAIDNARAAATRIVKAGEAAAIEIDESAIRMITASRTAFLDLSDALEVARPQAEARAIDLAPVEVAAAPRTEARALDLAS
jgi:hypothetical protein